MASSLDTGELLLYTGKAEVDPFPLWLSVRPGHLLEHLPHPFLSLFAFQDLLHFYFISFGLLG